VNLMTGIEARLIEAEAAFKAGNPAGMVAKLNQARTEGGVTGLAANLTDPGTDAARIDLLFTERALWLYGTGHRLGDLRRLVRQYNRGAESVYPTGSWWKGGNYGNQVTLPIPQSEETNLNYTASSCDPTKA